MKKLILLNLLLAFIWLHAGAQDRSIHFILAADMNWNDVLAQAQKEKKMIFIDCYTSWCGPCKRLAKDIFTRNEVADFYNEHFINIKYDVEKDPKFEMNNPFHIKSYPTLLYLSAQGDVVHALMGAYTAEITLANGQKAIDPENTLSALIKRYKEGARDQAFMRKYAEAAVYSARPDARDITIEYLNMLDDTDFYTEDSWNFIDMKLLPFLCAPVLRAIDNREKFEAIAGVEKFNSKIGYMILQAVAVYQFWEPGKYFNETDFNNLYNYLSTHANVHRQIPSWLESLEAAHEHYVGDFKSIVKRIGTAVETGFCPKELIKRLNNCKDRELIEKSITYLDHLIVNPRNVHSKALALKNKVTLLTQLGKTGDATNVQQELERIAQANDINLERL